MKKLVSSALSSAVFLATVVMVTPQMALARGGLPTIGGGNPVDCATTIRNVGLTSGGSRAKDQIGLGPDTMHVFVEFMWRPCTSPWEQMTFTVTDHETGVTQPVANGSWTYPVGYDVKWSAHTSNALFTHQYDVVIRTTNATTGALVQEWKGSVVTNNKL
jgi:hypothetical protein